MKSKWWFKLIAAMGLSILSVQCSAEPKCQAWPMWQDFNRVFITKDGRVVDPATEFMYTTSEGQSYAMFFALVNNDQALFDKLLGWTRNNLAEGDLTARLPAWQWGKRKDDSWGVNDNNSASDSDLWIAYDLLEAGRLWQQPRYTALGKLLAARILREETAELPGFGLTLLPASKGFHPDEDTWRLNPSYVPIFLLRAIRHHTGDERWDKILATSRRLLLESAPKGYAPDWINFVRSKGLQTANEKGSYDAIRVYSWLGMMHPDDPWRQDLLERMQPIFQYVKDKGVPPLTVDVASGNTEGTGSSGFSAALLPFFAANKDNSALEQQRLRLTAKPLSDNAASYYEQALGLFGLGWQQQRFRFDKLGLLQPAWDKACQ